MTVFSITRALAEVKRLDDQIQREISSGTWLALTVGQENQKKVYNSSLSVDQVKAKIQSSYDTVDMLMKRRDELKGKIVTSNAVTVVNVANRNITIAEAIELKKSVQLRRNLLAVLQQSVAVANSNVTKLNSTLEDTIQKNLEAVYSSDKSKMDPGAYDMIAKPQKAAKEASIFDPQDVNKYITELTKFVEAVDMELDYTLSSSNAKTEISVSW